MALGKKKEGWAKKDVRSPTDAVTWPVGNASRGTRAATGARLGSSQKVAQPHVNDGWGKIQRKDRDGPQ